MLNILDVNTMAAESYRNTVEELYKLRDCYAENETREAAEKKKEELTEKVQKIVKQLDEAKETCDVKDNPEFDLLKAKALNIPSDFNSEALAILTKIVKFHPKLIDAWNELGECFVKKNDMKSAKVSLEAALKEKKNAESLRKLSMVLRQLGDTHEEKIANIHQSVDRAKEAVNLNLQDGKSWYVLGNAYLSLFFTTSQNPNMLKQCLMAYDHAVVDDALKHNPDLNYNRAMALQYDENYRQTLECFEKAYNSDPLWNEPKNQLETLVKHLENIQTLITKKGKLKPRRIKELVKSLKAENEKTQRNANVGGSSQQIKFSELKAGLNTDKRITGKVVCQVYSSDTVRFTFCMLDEDETCITVNIYNMAPGKGVIIGDLVTIVNPYVQHFDFNHKEKAFCFTSVRVNSPQHLLVNKRKLGPEAEAASSISISLTSD